MKPLEEIDPELIDQVVCRLLARSRPPDREVAIATHLSHSAELREWVEILVRTMIGIPIQAVLFSAVSIGLEVGYELGGHEGKREAWRVQAELDQLKESL